VKCQPLVSYVFVLPLALVVGCKSESSPTGDAANADLAIGKDLVAQDLRPDQGADAGIERTDVLTQISDASADAATDRTGTKEDLVASSVDSAASVESGRADSMSDGKTADVIPVDGAALEAAPADVPPDGSPADTKPDGTTDGPVADGTTADTADAAASGGEAGCTGWSTLVRVSPAELADLMSKTDPIVINVHIPYEGDIPGTDTSIPYNDVAAIDAYLHGDHCAEVVLICKSGGMSKSAGDELVKRGYLRVRDLAGGFVAWQAAGYPLLKDGGI
jgi:phage shock protein E